MALALVGVSAAGTASSGATTTIPPVAGQQSGDLLILRSMGNRGALSGWSRPSVTGGSPGQTGTLLAYKVAAPADAGGWTVPSGDACVVLCYRGRAGAPFTDSTGATWGQPIRNWEDYSSVVSGASSWPDTHPRFADAGDTYVRIWMAQRSGIAVGDVTISTVTPPVERLRTVVGSGSLATVVIVNERRLATTGFVDQQTLSVSSGVVDIDFEAFAVVPALIRLGMVI